MIRFRSHVPRVIKIIKSTSVKFTSREYDGIAILTMFVVTYIHHDSIPKCRNKSWVLSFQERSRQHIWQQTFKETLRSLKRGQCVYHDNVQPAFNSNNSSRWSTKLVRSMASSSDSSKMPARASSKNWSIEFLFHFANIRFISFVMNRSLKSTRSSRTSFFIEMVAMINISRVFVLGVLMM